VCVCVCVYVCVCMCVCVEIPFLPNRRSHEGDARSPPSLQPPISTISPDLPVSSACLFFQTPTFTPERELQEICACHISCLICSPRTDTLRNRRSKDHQTKEGIGGRQKGRGKKKRTKTIAKQPGQLSVTVWRIEQTDRGTKDLRILLPLYVCLYDTVTPFKSDKTNIHTGEKTGR